MSELNEGVKILIDRMESNPEDFGVDFGDARRGDIRRGKFAYVGNTLRKRRKGEPNEWESLSLLTEEELTALDEAYLKMERKKFTESIMARLLDEPEKREEYAHPAVGASFIKATNAPLTVSANVPTTATGASLMLGANKLTETDVGKLHEMIEAWRKHD